MRAELWLLSALADGELDGLDGCLASGMLRAERDAVRFRHEIARVAVEEALAPHRRLALHRARARGARRRGARPDPARLAHHAEAADDADAVLRYAPAAGERAAMLGSHREAAAQFARALRYAGGLPPDRRAELLERRSYECYLTHDIAGAVEARRRALDEHRAAGDTRRQGDAHRWLSRLAWFEGNATAEEEARRAVELLEPLAPGRELAMAYSNMSQLRMLASDQPRRDRVGRAGDRARRAPRRDRDRRPRAQQRRARPSSRRRCRTGSPSSNAASRWRSRRASRSTWPARTPTWARARWRYARTRSAIAISRPASRTAPSTT